VFYRAGSRSVFPRHATGQGGRLSQEGRVTRRRCLSGGAALDNIIAASCSAVLVLSGTWNDSSNPLSKPSGHEINAALRDELHGTEVGCHVSSQSLATLCAQGLQKEH
jgi:hypothetical protein